MKKYLILFIFLIISLDCSSEASNVEVNKNDIKTSKHKKHKDDKYAFVDFKIITEHYSQKNYSGVYFEDPIYDEISYVFPGYRFYVVGGGKQIPELNTYIVITPENNILRLKYNFKNNDNIISKNSPLLECFKKFKNNINRSNYFNVCISSITFLTSSMLGTNYFSKYELIVLNETYNDSNYDLNIIIHLDGRAIDQIAQYKFIFNPKNGDFKIILEKIFKETERYYE